MTAKKGAALIDMSKRTPLSLIPRSGKQAGYFPKTIFAGFGQGVSLVVPWI